MMIYDGSPSHVHVDQPPSAGPCRTPSCRPAQLCASAFALSCHMFLASAEGQDVVPPRQSG